MKSKLVIQHDLSKLGPEQVTQYLRDVSEFIGLDPDLNGLDTIWMQNENGPGQSLVVYARRGTAEILREKHGIDVSSLTNAVVRGSLVFTATGKNKEGRQEVAAGSKFIDNLQGKALDDAIMTSSTRALRRLTMQFTKLGILDESEVRSTVGDTTNPAASAALSGSPMVIPPTPTVTNNAPGKDITPELDIAKVYAEGVAGLAALPVPGQAAPQEPTTAVEAAKPKRARKKSNTVSISDVEPEIVSSKPAMVAATVLVPSIDPIQAILATAATLPPVPAPVAPQPAPLPPPVPVQPPAALEEFPGKPTVEQMADYRKRVSVYTSELPSSENMGSVQKMRAFISKMSGAAPQFMTTEQWEEILAWFESFVATNKIKGLVKYINDSLGVK